jgi:hypothetical protein
MRIDFPQDLQNRFALLFIATIYQCDALMDEIDRDLWRRITPESALTFLKMAQAVGNTRLPRSKIKQFPALETILKAGSPQVDEVISSLARKVPILRPRKLCASLSFSTLSKTAAHEPESGEIHATIKKIRLAQKCPAPRGGLVEKAVAEGAAGG